MPSWETRFWKYVAVCEHGKVCDSCCWPWTGAPHDTQDDYGTFYVNNKVGQKRAHIVSWRLHNKLQRIPKILVVMHSCDYKPCVSPWHLSLGTKAENSQDAGMKGLMVRKLDEPDIVNMRFEYAHGMFDQEELAARYKVSRPRVGLILRGEAWRNVQDNLQPEIDKRRKLFKRLTAVDANAIRITFAEGGVTQSELGALYGITGKMVSSILLGQLWKAVDGPLKTTDRTSSGINNGNVKLVPSQVREIRKRHAQGAKQYRIAEEFDVSPRTIRMIVERTTWKHIT